MKITYLKIEFSQDQEKQVCGSKHFFNFVRHVSKTLAIGPRLTSLITCESLFDWQQLISYAFTNIKKISYNHNLHLERVGKRQKYHIYVKKAKKVSKIK